MDFNHNFERQVLGANAGFKLERGTLYTACAMATALILFPLEASAAFDLGNMVKGILDPLDAAIDTHYGKALIAMGAGGAMMSQGDLRTRMMGMGVGVAAGGLVMGGLKLGLA